MPRSLSPIPPGVAITDGKGIITIFFRLAWQLLVDGFQISPTIAAVDLTGQTAGIATTNVYTTISGASYRFSYALAKTLADGVNSSLQVTLGWTENGVAKTKVFAALTTDTTTAVDGQVWPFHADANSIVTYAIAYASNTPAKMTYDGHLVLEVMA